MFFSKILEHVIGFKALTAIGTNYRLTIEMHSSTFIFRNFKFCTGINAYFSNFPDKNMIFVLTQIKSVRLP